MRKGIAIVGLVVVICGIGLLSLGCTAVVRVPPPAARVEVYGSAPYPGAVWVGGYWTHRRGDWDWVPGHWARPPRPHAVWVPGHWEERRGGWVWHKGHWQ